MGNGVGETEWVSDGAFTEPIRKCDDNKSVDDTAETGNDSVPEKEGCRMLENKLSCLVAHQVNR